MRIAVTALMLTSVMLPIPVMGLDLYVSTNGNDSWNGRHAGHAERLADANGPFATAEVMASIAQTRRHTRFRSVLSANTGVLNWRTEVATMDWQCKNEIP